MVERGEGGGGGGFPELTREVRLVLECARTRLTFAHVERIESLLRPDMNWAGIVHFAEESAVAPLVYENLRKIAARVPVLVPAVWMERLQKICRANTVRALYQSAELVKILDALEGRGLQVIAYKGPVLGVQAYGDPALRVFYDLDVIVAQRDLAAADEVLRGLEFEARYAWPRVENPKMALTPGEYTYRGKNSQILLEVHTERTMRHFPVQLDLAALAVRLTTVHVAGRAVRTFRPEDALPILCVHGAKDFWEKAGNIADIAELVQLQPFDWNYAREAARALRCTTMMLLGLSLAQRLIGAPLPNAIAEEMYADKRVVVLTGEIARRMVVDRKPKWSAVGRAMYRSRLVDAETSAAAYLWRLAVSPAEDSWAPGQKSPLWATMRSLLYQTRRGKERKKEEEITKG